MASKLKNRLLRTLEAPSPHHIKRLNYAVTLVCNAFCKMCDIWRNDKGSNVYAYDDELKVRDLEKAFANEPLLAGLDEVSLTGGEPFLRADLDDIGLFFLDHFKNAKLTINSNFYVEDNIRRFLTRLESAKALDRLTLCFSLDGLQPLHDRLRGVKDGFQRIVECAREVRDRFHVPLVVSFTILPQNSSDLEGVYELSRTLGAGFTCRFGALSSHYYGNTRMDFKWRDDQLDAVDGTLARIVASMASDRPLLKRAAGVDLYFYGRLVDHQRNPRRLFDCYSGTHSCYLDSFGNVYPCIMLNEVLGNIKEQRLAEIWFSSRCQSVRDDIAAHKCECWTECETIPSLQRHASYLPVFQSVRNLWGHR